MMYVRCVCQSCQAAFKVDGKFAGKRIKCPKCEVVMTVPSEASGGTDSSLAAMTPPVSTPPFPASSPKPAAAPRVAKPLVPTQPLPPTQPGSSAVAVFADPPSGANSAASEASGISAAAGFRGIHAEPRPVAGGGRARTGAKRSKTTNKGGVAKATWMFVGGGVAVVLLLAGASWGVLAMRSGPSQEAGGTVPRGQAALVLNWPESERRDASLLIDGKPVSLSPTGQLVYPLTPGQHRMMIRRRGYESLEYSMALAAGERHQYATAWTRSAVAAALPTSGASGQAAAGGLSSSGLPTIDVSSLAMHSEAGPRGFGGWNQSLDVAERQAKAKGRDILILFTGSDWSHATQHFSNEVASTTRFRTFVAEQIELLVVDLPRTADGYNQVSDNAQNQHLARRYRIETVPTFVLTDASGLPYLIDTYDPSDGRGFLEFVEESRPLRAERDQLFAAARQGEPAERLDTAVRAVEWLDERELTRFYDPLVRQWHDLAKTHDANNEQGKLEVFFEKLWFVQLRETAEGQPDRLPRTVEALKAWSRDRSFVDPDRGARMNLVAAGVLAKLEQADQALPYIEQGLACQPNDRELREQLEAARAILQSADQLSSGSGFVVDPSGYLLTNHHVVEGPGRLVVRLPDIAEPVPATVVAKDERSDMALLRFQPPRGVTLSSLPVNDVVMGRGARVAAFGFPLGDSVGKGLKLTTGVISGLPDQSTENMLLLDCRINPGNSGGPLCNTSGQVVGMVTAKSANAFGVDSYGMAIPAGTLSQFLADHVPGYSASTEENEKELPWDAVDRLVSPSVLTVLKLK